MNIYGREGWNGGVETDAQERAREREEALLLHREADGFEADDFAFVRPMGATPQVPSLRLMAKFVAGIVECAQEGELDCAWCGGALPETAEDGFCSRGCLEASRADDRGDD